MEVWMVQKRYSASRIKTYLSFVRQFFAVRPDLHRNMIRVEDKNQYNFENFIFGNKSYRTQNQWINAIKIYIRVNGLDIGDLTDIERTRKSYSLPNVLTKEEVRKILVLTRNKKHKFLFSIIYMPD
ncbi:site-specific integrase [Membranihabitans marinus]|uniref:hypothetical protein n=1 Tax=Membranihabitans marinus TaxID=1227546 RepID=UPI001F42414F|nr:hypothetical protein [Membranihabitans marinus]